MKDRIDKILDFLKEIEKYKTIERKIILSNGMKESDAEHSWHMAMFLILFQKELPKEASMEKMLKLALIHDLVEIYAGDTFSFDEEARKDKKEREDKASEKLFSQLPEDLGKELKELFNDYNKRESKEAKIVNSIDKIQPILQNIVEGGKNWVTHNLTYEIIDEYKRKDMLHDGFLLNIYNRLMGEAKDKKLL